MIIQGPGGNTPHIPPQINPKEVGKKEESRPQQKTGANQAKPTAANSNIGRGPEFDSRALSVRLAALATDAKKKEIAHEDFERILEQAIALTGLKDGQAAMEEANKRLQKDIETQLERIKKSKDLMEEASAWQGFAELLNSMGEEQAEAFVSMMKESISEL